MTAIAEELPTLKWTPAVRQHGWAAAVLVMMAALWLVAGLSIAVREPSADYMVDGKAPDRVVRQLKAAAAATSATQLKQVSVEDARAINAAIPLSNSANPAARPFNMAGFSSADRLRAIDCLTAAIYYEAATEPTDGQRAVAQVVLNRTRHPAYPSSVCGVVFEGARRTNLGCQFSFTCDGSLRRLPMASYWERARRVAEAALSGYVYAPVGWATHYHTNWVVPYWASSLVKSANVGAHIFYRWSGGWGRPAAFGKRLPGVEPAIAWRGGFGQPTREEREAEALLAAERDALAQQAAADAAVEAATGGSVDSFYSAVLRRGDRPITRRYEPLQRDSANARITERLNTTSATQPVTRSQRWALTGDGETSSAQAPIARQPAQLEGVRFKADPPASGNETASGTREQ
jgi:spore germination cell wall hydrolase CwlJ-like protein